MTRALLTGCLLGCAVLAGYALGRHHERRRDLPFAARYRLSQGRKRGSQR